MLRRRTRLSSRIRKRARLALGKDPEKLRRVDQDVNKMNSRSRPRQNAARRGRGNTSSRPIKKDVSWKCCTRHCAGARITFCSFIKPYRTRTVWKRFADLLDLRPPLVIEMRQIGVVDLHHDYALVQRLAVLQEVP